MPPSLRKACHACTAAKRRCRPQLPQCTRCSEKGLSCTYDLEPVSNSQTVAPSCLPANQENLRQLLSTCIFDSMPSAHMFAIQLYTPQGFDVRHGLPRVSNFETFTLASEHLNNIPLLTFQHKSTPFVHAQVLSAAKGYSAVPLLKTGDNSSPDMATIFRLLETERQRLLSLKIQELSFVEFLAAFHELAAILVASFLERNRKAVMSSDFEDLVDLFTDWTKHFHSILPETLSSELSAWQAWVIAETARRTFFCTITVGCLLDILQHGFCYYRPGVESLPFDPRTGLWEANTEGDWEATVATHGSKESNLMSWCEFIESGGPEPRRQHDGALQRLLLVGHFGKAAADAQSKA
ncbi:uncharacterized protein Z518_09769 [Rhinocladiella mackenziei CBS 650.93]|uniref:Zn(2)-C6 fungal-type domain-containing protein n=1 Tax=Rhinocladiella mackenziei CBS 650.93 TaxID=1442369 RepID=A0A0D2I4I1_9EURO|nr:uncharacterized protein Z518_09769 [Rhinocladiella mackenziei CBS 650.93]KIX00704.1 hypothetical protein Z518_09769 [Rhinocladiella mackenziei CBS 650.93]